MFCLTKEGYLRYAITHNVIRAYQKNELFVYNRKHKDVTWSLTFVGAS